MKRERPQGTETRHASHATFYDTQCSCAWIRCHHFCSGKILRYSLDHKHNHHRYRWYRWSVPAPVPVVVGRSSAALAPAPAPVLVALARAVHARAMMMNLPLHTVRLLLFRLVHCTPCRRTLTMLRCFDLHLQVNITPAMTLAWASKHRGQFIVGGRNTPALGLKGIHKSAVPFLMPHLMKRSGKPCVIIDVGAATYGDVNGYDYSDTLIFLSIFDYQCSIHAFDLSGDSLRQLEKTANHTSLYTHRVALSDEVGDANIRTPHDRFSLKNLWSIANDATLPGHAGRIPSTTLDKFADDHGLAHVTYAKVDVQGHDPQVARGMKRILSEQRLSLGSFEYSQHWGVEDSLGRFQAWMSSFGYSTYLVAADIDRASPKLIPVSKPFWGAELELCEPGGSRRCVIDVLVVPRATSLERRLLRKVNAWRCD
jgi:FkbM family methyltransferase